MRTLSLEVVLFVDGLLVPFDCGVCVATPGTGSTPPCGLVTGGAVCSVDAMAGLAETSRAWPHTRSRAAQ